MLVTSPVRRVRPVPRLAAAVAAVTLLLTGCAQNAPGVAAEVGGDAVTDEQVDELAEALCVLSSGGEQAGPVPTQQVRRQALQILVDNELAEDLVDPESVDRDQVAAAVEQAAPSVEALPADLRGPFSDAVEAFATAQLGLTALGRESLAEEGTDEPDEQAVAAEAQRLRVQHAEEAGVAVDPRFGVFEEGRLQPSDGSLSVAVSDAAKASSGGDAVGTDLPANLTCSAG